jgi:hypothetical protein
MLMTQPLFSPPSFPAANSPGSFDGFRASICFVEYVQPSQTPSAFDSKRLVEPLLLLLVHVRKPIRARFTGNTHIADHDVQATKNAHTFFLNGSLIV